jgi:L-lactate utilization protein LutB/heterodisulfide reductase subunit B
VAGLCRAHRGTMTEADLRERIREAVEDRTALDGMRRSFKTILGRQKENASRIPDLESRKDRLRKMKESSVGNEDLFTQALAVLRENGFRVVIAKTAEAAVRKIKDELQGYDLVVKSKSNVTKELHLAEHLEKSSIKVIETDLGDRIVQLAGCEAAHPTGPACHLTRNQISELFTKHFEKRVSDDPMELTRVMRDEIASYISKAKVGITGANAIAACEGAVVIVHNEGNAAKCAMLPDKHIIITTPEKVVPNLDDAINVTKLQTYLSTGKIISSYINVITGPSYTADIEKQVYKGMHGPKEVVIIFVDDGRLEAADKEAQYCIGCGMCLLHCPTYNVVGPVFGTSGHMGGIGVYLEGSMEKIDGALQGGLFTCTSCGACVEVCPSKIDTKKGIISTRTAARVLKKRGTNEHESLVASVKNYDNPWQVPRRQKSKWSEGLGLKKKGEILYFAGCSTSLLFPESAKRVVRVMRALGVEPAHLSQDERCCGSTVRKLGEETLARDKAESCFKDFKAAGAKTVITSCPGCSSALNHYPELTKKYGVKVQHVSQFLDENLDKSMCKPVKDLESVTFHDPCDLGRAQNVYEEPRRVLAKALGRDPIEMELSRTYSACCGSGSGVKSAYAGLAEAIGRDRIAMAKAAGAKTVVTSCPWCEQNLRECQGEAADVAVMDLVDVVERSMSKTGVRKSRKRS